MLFNRQIIVIFAKILYSNSLSYFRHHSWSLWEKTLGFSSHHFSKKRLEKLLVREALSQIRNWSGGFLNIIWGQTDTDSASVHCLLGHLKEKLVDTMEQSERLAWREINDRSAHDRWLRRMYPNRILCINWFYCFTYSLTDGAQWFLGRKENTLHLSDLAKDQAHVSFVFPWARAMLVIKLPVTFYSDVSI